MRLLWVRAVVDDCHGSEFLRGRGGQSIRAHVFSIYLVAFIGAVPIFIGGRCGSFRWVGWLL